MYYYDAVCTLPLTADLFAQAISPRQPFLAVGLASGHVQCFKLPPESYAGASNDDVNDERDTNGEIIAAESGYGLVGSAWRTRRHKGSCRTLSFSTDGEKLVSAGTDGIVKVALSETGRVEGKIAVLADPFSSTGTIDAPTLVHILTPQNLMLATDSGALHLYDLRSKDSSFASSKPAQTHHPHDDYVSSLTTIPASAASTSGFPKQVVTTGGTTLAVTDIRRGVLAKSEDQGEELLSSCFVGGLSSRGTNVGEKLVVGSASGALSLWEKGVWDDMDERIVLDKGPGGGESVDTLVGLPDGVPLSEGGKGVVAGMGNGMMVFCAVGGQNGIVDILRHDEVEGVVGLGFDVAGRMISGGGQKVKVWHEVGDIEADEEDEEDGEGEEVNGKRAGSEDSESWEDEDSSEDEKPKKKRKRGKGLAGVNGTRFSFQGLD